MEQTFGVRHDPKSTLTQIQPNKSFSYYSPAKQSEITLIFSRFSTFFIYQRKRKNILYFYKNIWSCEVVTVMRRFVPTDSGLERNAHGRLYRRGSEYTNPYQTQPA